MEARYRVDGQLGAGRIGARVELAPGVLTVSGGAGLGGAAVGPIFAADLGLVLGWENSVHAALVPFLSVASVWSEPLDRTPLRIYTASSDTWEPLTETRSVGFHATLGLRAPMRTDDPRTRVSLVVVFGVTQLWGVDLPGTPHVGVLGGAGMLEVAFDSLDAHRRPVERPLPE